MYNPIIRYLFLNSIKLNFMAFIVFRPPIGGFLDIVLASIIMVLIIGIPIFFLRLLRKNRKSLNDEKQSNVFGALYQGKNVMEDAQHEFIYPLIFFYRRTIFIIATIFLFDFPTLQTVVNTVLSFSSLVYLFSDRHQYNSKQQKVIELSTEGLYYAASLFMAQLNDSWHSNESTRAIEDSTLACIGLMIIINIGFLVLNAIQKFKAKRRLKVVE